MLFCAVVYPVCQRSDYFCHDRCKKLEELHNRTECPGILGGVGGNDLDLHFPPPCGKKNAKVGGIYPQGGGRGVKGNTYVVMRKGTRCFSWKWHHAAEPPFIVDRGYRDHFVGVV